MSKYKVAVYAICKNEEKFIDRWVDSMQEADEIYVLDTGSLDNSIKKLKQRGVNVQQEIITPWRFDVARNKSLELVPDEVDICVCTDLDEVFVKGWRQEIEKIWQNNTDSIRYNLNCNFDGNDQPKTSLYIEKIHTKKHFKWIYPVHEVLEFTGLNKNTLICDTINLNHYPDNQKSRSQYLSLLEMAVKEMPDNDRVWHYLGREYMYYQKWDKCIETLTHHLKLPSSNWKDERCASMRYIAASYIEQKKYDLARQWLEKAILEAPYLREPLVEYGTLEYSLKNYKKATELLEKAIKIKQNNKTYINEQFSLDNNITDILSICYYNLNNKAKAIYYGKQALKLSPDNERIKNNQQYFKEMKSN